MARDAFSTIVVASIRTIVIEVLTTPMLIYGNATFLQVATIFSTRIS
jgi:hypothetical protein